MAAGSIENNRQQEEKDVSVASESVKDCKYERDRVCTETRLEAPKHYNIGTRMSYKLTPQQWNCFSSLLLTVNDSGGGQNENSIPHRVQETDPRVPSATIANVTFHNESGKFQQQEKLYNVICNYSKPERHVWDRLGSCRPQQETNSWVAMEPRGTTHSRTAIVQQENNYFASSAITGLRHLECRLEVTPYVCQESNYHGASVIVLGHSEHTVQHY